MLKSIIHLLWKSSLIFISILFIRKDKSKIIRKSKPINVPKVIWLFFVLLFLVLFIDDKEKFKLEKDLPKIKILMFNQATSYYSDHPVFIAYPAQNYLDFDSFNTSEQLREGIKKHDITHILYTEKNQFHLNYTEHMWNLFEDLFNNSKLLYENEGNEIVGHVWFYEV